MFMSSKCQHHEVSILPNRSTLINAIPIKFLNGVFYVEIYKLIIKFIWKIKLPIILNILMKKKLGEFAL